MNIAVVVPVPRTIIRDSLYSVSASLFALRTQKISLHRVGLFYSNGSVSGVNNLVISFTLFPSLQRAVPNNIGLNGALT